LAYHTHGIYDKFDEGTKQRYEELAQEMGLQSGAEAYVAQSAIKNLWRGRQEQPWRVASKGRQDPWLNLKLENATLYDKNGNTIFTPQENIRVTDGTLDKALVFIKAAAKKNLVDVPSDLLELTEGVETKGSNVEARVHAANNNKTYVVIDKGSLDKVHFTEGLMQAFLAAGSKGSFEEAGDGMYKIKEGAEDDVMIPIDTERIRGLIDAWTGNKFSEALKTLPPAQKEPIDIIGL
jgi:hypothetical protein